MEVNSTIASQIRSLWNLCSHPDLATWYSSSTSSMVHCTPWSESGNWELRSLSAAFMWKRAMHNSIWPSVVFFMPWVPQCVLQSKVLDRGEALTAKVKWRSYCMDRNNLPVLWCWVNWIARAELVCIWTGDQECKHPSITVCLEQNI